jgi:hypothetical protein
MRSDSSAFPVALHETIYSDVFPIVRAIRGFWLLVALQSIGWAVLLIISNHFYELSAVVLSEEGIAYGPLGRLSRYSVEQSYPVLPNLFLNLLFALPLYVVSCLSFRMSRGLGIAILAIAGLVILYAAGLGVFNSIIFWDELLSKHNIPTFIGGTLIFSMLYLYFSILFLKGGYRYVVSDNFTRMLVADAYEKRVFSLGSVSKSLGLPFSMEHIRHRRLRILTYFIISSLLYMIFSATLFLAPFDLSLSISFTAVPGGGGALFLSMANLVIIGVVCLAGGVLTRNIARRAARTSILELQKLDARAPILFLRAFRDDQVYLAPPRLSLLGYFYDLGRRDSNLDVLLLEEGTDYGPVIALGNPNDPVPPYGAARGYFDDGSWHHAIALFAQVSPAIIICLDDTDGIWWEVDHVAANDMLQKTLFLVHPRNSAAAKNKNLLRKVAQRLALSDDLKGKLLGCVTHVKSPPGSVIGFFIDRHHSLKVARSATFSRVAFLMILRWFVRTRLDATAETD